MVIAVIGVLIALVISVIGMVQRAAEKRRAEADVNALVQAVLHYRQVYGAWPHEDAHSNGALFVAGVTTGANAYAALNGLPSPEIDQASVLSDLTNNPRGVLFLTPANRSLSDGRLVDPWGTPYLLVMNAGLTTFFLGDRTFSNLSVFACSHGPDTSASPTNWIYSAGVMP